MSRTPLLSATEVTRERRREVGGGRVAPGGDVVRVEPLVRELAHRERRPGEALRARDREVPRLERHGRTEHRRQVVRG